MTARRLLLDGLARDDGIFELLSGLALLHPRTATFSGEVSLHVAADALEWCGPAGPSRCPRGTARAVPIRGHLPRPPERQAPVRVLAAAAVHGGAEPDLLGEVASWHTDDFWQYAMYAAVACIRAAASRAGVPVPRQVRT
jgi:hypothetical protein